MTARLNASGAERRLADSRPCLRRCLALVCAFDISGDSRWPTVYRRQTARLAPRRRGQLCSTIGAPQLETSGIDVNCVLLVPHFCEHHQPAFNWVSCLLPASANGRNPTTQPGPASAGSTPFAALCVEKITRDAQPWSSLPRYHGSQTIAALFTCKLCFSWLKGGTTSRQNCCSVSSPDGCDVGKKQGFVVVVCVAYSGLHGIVLFYIYIRYIAVTHGA